jgi:hypothetical protein
MCSGLATELKPAPADLGRGDPDEPPLVGGRPRQHVGFLGGGKFLGGGQHPRMAFDDDAPPLCEAMLVGLESDPLIGHGAGQLGAFGGPNQHGQFRRHKGLSIRRVCR